ncbi:MAG: hypothetical protein ACPGXZ_00765 [Saprospiraceae bacterium]
MGRIYQYPNSLTATNGGVLSNSETLPPKLDFVPLPSGWLHSTEQWWNNRKCAGDGDYFQCWLDEDVFRFQLALPDAVNNGGLLTKGWRTTTNNGIGNYYVSAELLNMNGSVLMSNVDLFANNYFVTYHSQRGAKQYFEIDTSKLALGTDKFYIKVQTYDNTGTTTQTIVSEPFGYSNGASMWIEYYWRKQDDISRYYLDETLRIGAGVWSNFVGGFRVPGYIGLDSGGQAPQQADNDTIVSTEITRTYVWECFNRQYPSIPDYLGNQLITAFFADVAIVIDNKQYTDFTEVAKSSDDESSMAWQPSGTANVTVEVRGFGCE